MKLKYALKSIVEEEGKEILNDLRVINILSDYKSFEEVPASKHILKMLIVEEYMKRLLDFDEWTSKSEQLSQQFVLSSGFQEEYVNFVFNSISYALGFQEISPENIEDSSLIETRRRTLEDIIEIDENSMTEKEITISNVFIEYAGKKWIHLTYEVYKAHDYTINTYVVIFDKKGRVRKKEFVDTIWNNEHHRFMETRCELPVPRTNISRILITAY